VVVPPIAGAPCSEFPQCGCTGTLNCDVANAKGMTACVASGTTPPYNNCDAVGQCEKGYSCIGGVCKPFCGTASDCPGSGRVCDNVVDQNNNKIPGASICTLNCDPLNPQDSGGGWSACGSNTNCAAIGTKSAPYSDCYGPASATATQGTSCAGSSGAGDGPCAPGYICLTPDAGITFSCFKNCRVGNNADCSTAGSGKTCHGYGTPTYVGTTQYGYCN
jgi:hypothetical protein